MLKLVGVLALVTVAHAAVYRYPPQPKPAEFADQEGCYISSLNRVLPYDQPFYGSGACDEYLCQRSTNETQQNTCGAVGIRPGCVKSQDDLTLNYPDCCGTEVCPSTTVAPTTEASTTQAPAAPANQPPVAYASAQAVAGQPPVTEVYTSGPGAQAQAGAGPTTTQQPTTEASTTQAPTTQTPTTQASTTQAPTTQASTTQGPAAPAPNQPSVAYASANSGPGQPPATQIYSSGPGAQASATAS